MIAIKHACNKKKKILWNINNNTIISICWNLYRFVYRHILQAQKVLFTILLVRCSRCTAECVQTSNNNLIAYPMCSWEIVLFPKMYYRNVKLTIHLKKLKLIILMVLKYFLALYIFIILVIIFMFFTFS
jgi:hypothetical protein